MRSIFRVGLLLFIAAMAKAETFNFIFNGERFGAYGIMAGDLVSPGIYQITSISGRMTAWHEGDPLDEIQFLYPAGEINGADNLLFMNGGPFVDQLGINFYVGDESGLAFAHDDLGYKIVGCFEGSCSPNNQLINRGDLIVSSAVPEPSTLLLIASGAVVGATRLRRLRGV